MYFLPSSESSSIHLRANKVNLQSQEITNSSTCRILFVANLTTLSVLKIYGVRLYEDKRNGQDMQGSGHGLIKALSCIHIEGLRKQWKTAITIAGVPASIQTGHQVQVCSVTSRPSN
jgi:hypothetical protein